MSDTPESKVYGYEIDGNFFYHVASRVLIKIGNDSEPTNVKVVFRTTMANLFLYLMTHSGASPVKDAEILENVWELNGLKSSYQRLWKVMRNLTDKLHTAGIESPLFYRVNSNAYLVRRQNISVIYQRVDKDESGTFN